MSKTVTVRPEDWNRQQVSAQLGGFPMPMTVNELKEWGYTATETKRMGDIECWSIFIPRHTLWWWYKCSDEIRERSNRQGLLARILSWGRRA
jgi:hypothetical protein